MKSICSRRNNLYLLSILIAFAIFPSCLMAENSFHIGKHLHGKLNGFGTLGLTVSDSNVLGFRRELTQKHVVLKDHPRFETDSRIGVQISCKYSSFLEANAQFIANDQSKENPEDYVRQAFITARLFPGCKIRAGRLPIDAFLISEYRDVGYAYLWARPAPEFYTPILFNSFEGVDGSCRHALGKGTLEARFSMGKFNTLLCLDETSAPVDVKISNFWNTTIQYNMENHIFRLGYTKGTFDSISNRLSLPHAGYGPLVNRIPDPHIKNIFFDILDEFYVIDSHVSHISFATMYENKNWIIQGEAGRLQYEKLMDMNYTSGYLSIGYHMGKFTPFVVAARIDSSTDALPMQILPLLSEKAKNEISQKLISFYNIQCEQTTLSLGLRWDLLQNMALKLQWNHHWVTNKNYLWGKGNEKNKIYDDAQLNTFSVNLEFIF